MFIKKQDIILVLRHAKQSANGSKSMKLKSFAGIYAVVFLTAMTLPALSLSSYGSIPSSGIIAYSSLLLRGVNISPRDFWESSKISASDFDRIRSWGMTHVALHLHWRFVEPNRDNAGVYNEEFLERVDEYVKWARYHNIYVIIGMSKGNDGGDTWIAWEEFFHDSVIRERFYDVWSMIAARYSQFDNLLAFEFMLDPSHKSAENNITELDIRQDIWHNTMMPELIDRVRQINEKVTLIYKPVFPLTRYGNLLPIKDEHVFYAINFFEPHSVTHRLQSYDWDKEKLRNTELWQNWINFGRAYNVSLYIAGWGMRIRDYAGVLHEPPSEDHQLWIHHVAQLADEHNVHWSYWVFGYDRWHFDLLNSDGSERAIVEVLRTYTAS